MVKNQEQRNLIKTMQLYLDIASDKLDMKEDFLNSTNPSTLAGIIFDKNNPKREYNKIENLFKRASKEGLKYFCGKKVEEREEPVKHEDETIDDLENKLASRIMRVKPETKDHEIFGLLKGHIKKYGSGKLPKKLGKQLSEIMIKNQNPRIARWLISRQDYDYSENFFRVKDFSKTLNRIYDRTRRWLKDD